MKNPLLTIIALLVLAGILFAQGPPSSTSAHSVVRQVELVGPIQVEGRVPLRNHISIPFAASLGSFFYWVCPPGTHARGTGIRLLLNGLTVPNVALELASGAGSGHLGAGGDAEWKTFVLHPGDTLRLEGTYHTAYPGILQLAVEYD